MNGRIEPEVRTRGESRSQAAADASSLTASALGLPGALPASLPPVFDADADLGNGLPPDHPAWVRDTVSISQRARQALASLRPVVVRVVTLWDHAVRSITVGGRRLEVDASGSYRMP